MKLTRRDFGRMALGGLALSPLTLRLAPASEGSTERKFLFIFAPGGWDYSYVFAPLFDNSWVATDPESTTAEAHGIPYVDAESRPAVRAFFEDYGDRAAIINGMEVRSITHAVCTRLVFTGTTQASADDFASILAAHSTQDLVLPHVILSGPSYGYRYTSQAVRMGPDGQLSALLDARSMNSMNLSASVPDSDVEARVQTYIRARAQGEAELSRRGWSGRVQSIHSDTLDKLQHLEDRGLEMSTGQSGMTNQINQAVSLLADGLSRCVTLQHEGFYEMAWDTHSTNVYQEDHFQIFFESVNEAMAALDSTISISGRPLSEEVTVVLLSEMGRDPRLNAQEGKHHWTHTSAMLVGAGVAGGQVIGAYDENVSSSPVDLASGEVHESGSYLLPSHLGATLMALGDVDAVPYLGDVEPIEALIE